jgi:ABC-2 type transport system permease protein
MVTPIRPAELIIGKTMPFMLIGLGDVFLVTMLGVLWFQVPFRANPLVLLLGTILFLLSALGIGLLISTACTTQQQAFSITFFCVTPAIMLGGFGFPIASMPKMLQWFTYLDPLRFYLVVLRSAFLKGAGLSVLWPELLALTILGTSALTIATLRFHKTLD